ncbi:bifunctional 3-(3-hydroxy-phenyl)propionate/3-hydroxycinnamic acid hydroxylase [Variovorax saccharolyticus]|uniref:bifunctional 3-(3-hydroxy-phenyl)propionate/3-hydroxycinnamic acid hydroxylase n=1 Tax=Variovorax saccharolyticus TaxID=3053516 RepID=UPI00257534D9|nr:bifunctional 3-(3-hydroxy-phenyl)propionate/3-hydroxycinnamic acid hydroxylase [Variovorax sp. J31P216]MDM0028372.1 bifunctional 3-(3-hydroxy-phenyl)propionate/3-hydroxycinnamic acid hydroxylase [Variovorax sp. J31P216]
MIPNLFDVAIVGYGPAGQVAAGLLGQKGLNVYVCERLEDVYQIPRAIALDHEIMRVFQQLDVADAVQPFCEPFTNSEYFGVGGELIRRMTMVAPPYPQGYTPSMVFTQPAVERALRARVAQLPNVIVDLGAELHGIEQDVDGVTLQISTSDGTEKSIRAKFAIACDGGSSGVRTQLGMTLDDLDFDEPWLVVDVLVNEQGLRKLPDVSVQYCEPERPCTLVIGPRNHRRWEISLKPDEDPSVVATAEETWKLLARWLTPADGELWRQASYRFHALVATSWRKDRVFLAGDAAHMQPPFLGQGMCQGIRDAANLTWKLASVIQGEVRGEAAEALLDSYGIERKAHVRELTSRIKGVGAVICERDPDKARARDAKLLSECGGVVKDTPRQDILPRLEGGLLSAHLSAARGSLFPQPWLEVGDCRKRMDELLGNGWRLVTAEGAARPSEAVTSGLTLRTLSLADYAETDGITASWFRTHECSAALIRPDNYVYGVAGTQSQLDALIAEAGPALGAAATCLA